ncbi:alpha/beta hydrolase [Maribacter sp. HTCC2170]|uniref:alpha/beta hydrolase n=1 Tax=Maribacter sp. (strain HTCC2170 / KCCM 42371) TaxID=313603 RepID=UPI00006B1AC5|nr:alpha/beta hydrolase [Maribacter sp. HTCC2170]EAR00870.1 endo-1,4-beta-xylanase B [Maribacter sp. HTCC2170]
MKTSTIFVLFLFFCQIQAQEEIALWRSGEKPYYKENKLQEYEKEAWGTRCVFDIIEPTLTIYKAKGKNTGKAVIIIPGGGYELVAMYHEGYDLAESLAKQGVTAAVLKYRLPNPETSSKPHMVPLSDGRKALQLMHDNAARFEIDNNQIGVLGFSAGSHLATVLSLWVSKDESENPDFSGLIYGVTKLSKANLEWLEKSLYYRKLTNEEIKQNTLLKLVTKKTPPAFLVHANDDDICPVEETTLYAQELFDKNVLAETHIFPKGGHGFGMGRSSDGTDQWVSLFVNWIKNNQF